MSLTSRDILRLIYKGDPAALDSSLEASGIDVHTVVEPDRWNLLHRALVSVSRAPDASIISYLVKKGVDVNARDARGWTPLHFAARLKHCEIMRILLDAGADVDAENDEGITPLRLTLLSQPIDLEATEVLLAHDADPEHELRGRSVRDFANLIAHGLDADLSLLFSRY